MNEIMKFLGDVNTPVAIATIENNKPRVRMFSFKMFVDGNLYFLTSKKKDVYEQLLKNPYIQLCSMPTKDTQWIRISGKVEFVEDVELNKKAFDLLPLLKKAYSTPDNKEIVLLKITEIDARKYSLTGSNEKISF